MRGYLQPPSTPQPKKEEWALIATQQKREYQEFMQQERQREHQRKIAFREALDMHVLKKKNQGLDDKLQEKRYRERMIQGERQLQYEEARVRQEKIMERRAVEQQNQAMLSSFERSPSDPMHKPLDGKETFSIGVAAEQQLKRHRELNVKIMHDELEKQLTLRNQEIEHTRMITQDQELKDRQYALERERKRLEDQRKIKYHQQNMAVYNQFQQLQLQKLEKERQLNDKLVEQPASQRELLEELRARQQMVQRNRQHSQIKDSLIEQMEKHNKEKSNHSFNANDYSYKLYDKMFEDKRKGYDKQEYLRYLKEQQAEKKRRQEAEKYMNEQEYRLNMNQLNKVVSGEYSNPNYKDRSPINIGNPEEVSRKKDELYRMVAGNAISSSPRMAPPGSPSQSTRLATPGTQLVPQDVDAVRQRLEQLRSYRTVTHSP